jgi:hypothetical protein
MSKQVDAITIVWRIQLTERYTTSLPIEAIAKELGETVDEIRSRLASGALFETIDANPNWLTGWEDGDNCEYIGTDDRSVESVKPKGDNEK